MKPYHHPGSFRPPLAFGGHEFAMGDEVSYCRMCGGQLPTWALHEGFWPTYIARWCPAKVRALAPTSTEIEGQMSIFDVLEEA